MKMMIDVAPSSFALVSEDQSFDFEGAALENGWVFHQELVRWRAAREAFDTEADSLWSTTWAQYDRMDADARDVFDQRRARLAAGRVVYRTRHINALLKALRGALRRAEISNRDQQGAVMVMGAPGVGKTTAMTECMFALASSFYTRQFGEAWITTDPRRLLRPYENRDGDKLEAQAIFALPVRITENATPKGLMTAMLMSLAAATGDEALARMVGRSRSMDRGQLSLTLAERLKVHGVRMILVDDIHFVRRNRDGEEIINMLKAILNSSRAVFVIAGVAGAGGLEVFAQTAGSTQAQIGLRSVTVRMDAFDPPSDASAEAPDDLEEWALVVEALTSRVLLLRQSDEWWLEPETLVYLWKRTQGVFESLDRLLVNAAMEAIGEQEYIDTELLETVRISDVADQTARERYGLGPLVRRKPSRGARRRGPGRSALGDDIAERLLRPAKLAAASVVDPHEGLPED